MSQFIISKYSRIYPLGAKAPPFKFISSETLELVNGDTLRGSHNVDMDCPPFLFVGGVVAESRYEIKEINNEPQSQPSRRRSRTARKRR